MSDPRSNRTDLTGDRLRTIQPLPGAAVGVLDTDRTTLYGRTVLTGLQGTPSASAAAVPTREEGYACLTSPPKRCSSRRPDLQAGALRLPEVLMQSVTLVAPAIATLFSFGFIVGSFAGLMAPFAFAIVLLIALMLAINLSMLARLFPSAGGYFTYISRAIHPRVGMFAGWLYFLINPLVPGVILVYMGTVLDNELQAKYDFNFPWWLFVILGIGVIMFVAYRGISLSGKLLIILGSLEILIVVALSVWGAFDPGPGGFNFEPLNPANLGDVGANGIYLGVVFGIFSITGWEGACPIAEESENPHDTVPEGAGALGDHHGPDPRHLHVVPAPRLGHRQGGLDRHGRQPAAADPGRPVLGQRLLDRAHRADQLDARGVHRLEPRRDAHVLLDGAHRRTACVVRQGAPQVQDADQRRPCPVRGHRRERRRSSRSGGARRTSGSSTAA